MGLNMKERKPLLREAAKRYQETGTKKEKSAILDELVGYTKMNRKYLVHVLANAGRTKAARKTAAEKRRKGGGRKPIYSGEFTVALRAIWAFFWYRCGKILAPFMREQMRFLEGPFRISPEVGKLLLSVSPATIDRVLRADKKRLALKGRSGTKPGNLLKNQIPVRVRYADSDKKPGFFENDTVHHCGTSDSGEFLLTLTSTDVYSGWTELRAVPNKAHKWTFEALADVRDSLPFPLLGIDSDNGAEFINNALLKWCQKEGIMFTRSRPYRKNDNCHVEQKNNSHVRNFVGYRRFSGAGELGALARVYRSLCPLLNYFIPTQKLLGKTRVGAKVKKVYDKNILTPCQRLMLSTDLSDEVKAELARRMGLHDPVRLQREVHDAVAALMSLNGKRNLEDAEALALSALQAG